jgi:sulfotransferase
MRETIHFISGLPRAGSTLLSALLAQNPRFHASMSSPVCVLFNALQQGMSQGNEYSLFIDDRQRARILRSCVDAFYEDLAPERVVFDTNRLWTAKMAALGSLFPGSKVVCCVRNVAWVIDSIESLIRRNFLQPSKIFNYETGGTVYSRAESLAAATGMVGAALFALREAVYGDQADRLLLVRFESLTADPLETLRKVYEFLGEPPFEHDPNRVEACPGTAEFDARVGTPGLHHLARSVIQQKRRSILPTELFARYEPFSFWQNPAETPAGLRVI